MKAEDPMAMMREAHRELSASYQQVAANKKPSARLCRWFCMKFVRLEVNQMNYSNIHYVNLRAEMARGNIGIGQMAKALHISRDTMARKLAAASGRGVPDARSVLSIVQYRSTVPGRKGRARRIKHLAQLVDYFVFLLGRCARALAAAVLLALPVRPSRSTFDAAVAALALVCLELRNVLPPFFGE